VSPLRWAHCPPGLTETMAMATHDIRGPPCVSKVGAGPNHVPKCSVRPPRPDRHGRISSLSVAGPLPCPVFSSAALVPAGGPRAQVPKWVVTIRLRVRPHQFLDWQTEAHPPQTCQWALLQKNEFGGNSVSIGAGPLVVGLSPRTDGCSSFKLYENPLC
jgi:hypothetical protein